MSAHLPRWMRAIAFAALWPCLPASSVGGLGAHVLVAAAPPSNLSTGYSLPVVAVPPPPPMALIDTHQAAGCPVDMRAIVVSEPPEKSFVMLAWDDHSTLVQEGQGARTPLGWVAVSEVHDDYAVLRAGGETFHCVPGDHASAKPSAATTR